MTIDYKLLGQNIKYYRSKKRMKQAALAEIVDVTPEHISHIECSYTKASLPLLLSIAQALDTDIYTLMGEGMPNSRLDAELAELFQCATPEQKRLCIEISRAVLQHGSKL